MTDDLKKNKYLLFTENNPKPLKTKAFLRDKNTEYLYSRMEKELPEKEQEKVTLFVAVAVAGTARAVPGRQSARRERAGKQGPGRSGCGRAVFSGNAAMRKRRFFGRQDWGSCP